MSAQATATVTSGPPVGPGFRIALPPPRVDLVLRLDVQRRHQLRTATGGRAVHHAGAVGRTDAATPAGWAP